MYSRLAILERNFSGNGGKVRSFWAPRCMRGAEPWEPREDWALVSVVNGHHLGAHVGGSVRSVPRCCWGRCQGRWWGIVEEHQWASQELGRSQSVVGQWPQLWSQLWSRGAGLVGHVRTVSPKRAVEDLERKAADPHPWTLWDSCWTSLELGGEGR